MRYQTPIVCAVSIAAILPAAIAQNPAQSAPLIKSIQVQFAGASTVSEDRILANMRTRVGQPYSDTVVEEDIRNLYGSGVVSNVRIFGEPQSDGVRVIVLVQGKSVLKEIEVNTPEIESPAWIVMPEPRPVILDVQPARMDVETAWISIQLPSTVPSEAVMYLPPYSPAN